MYIISTYVKKKKKSYKINEDNDEETLSFDWLLRKGFTDAYMRRNMYYVCYYRGTSK